MTKYLFVTILVFSLAGVCKPQNPIVKEGKLTVMAGTDEPAGSYAEGLARYRISGIKEPYSEKKARRHLKALVNWCWDSLENAGIATSSLYPDVYALAIMPPQVVPLLLKELHNKTKIKVYPDQTVGDLVLAILQGHKVRYEWGNLGVDWYTPGNPREEYERSIRRWWKKAGRKLMKDYFLSKPASKR